MKLSGISYVLKFFLIYLVGSFTLAIFITWIQNNPVTLSNTGFLFSIIFFTAYLSGVFGKFFFKYFETKPQNEIMKKIIPALFFFWLGSLLIATLSINFSKYLWNHEQSYSFINLHDFLFALRALFPWIFISSIIFFYMLWRKAINREQKLNQELLKFQYQTLKDKVNPHFLFNSLNTLSSLINISPEKADGFTNKLSDIYRYILINENKHEVILKDEIDFVKNYFDLQKIRDEDKIVLEINIDNSERYLIVPVSLQILIENALKHNSATRKNPLKITISKEDEFLKVVNNLQRKTNIELSYKTGLQNLNERVKLILEKELIIRENKTKFEVYIPIKEK